MINMTPSSFQAKLLGSYFILIEFISMGSRLSIQTKTWFSWDASEDIWSRAELFLLTLNEIAVVIYSNVSPVTD